MKSKQAHYKYFKRNWNNIKNTQKGMKFLISLHVPTTLLLYGDTITNPYGIANTFNNWTCLFCW